MLIRLSVKFNLFTLPPEEQLVFPDQEVTQLGVVIKGCAPKAGPAAAPWRGADGEAACAGPRCTGPPWPPVPGLATPGRRSNAGQALPAALPAAAQAGAGREATAALLREEHAGPRVRGSGSPPF